MNSTDRQRRVPVDHSLRVSLSEIMHGRYLPIAATPARVRQWLVLLGEEGTEARANWLRGIGGDQVRDDIGRHAIIDDQSLLIWEAHTEFSTVTVVRTGNISRSPIDECAWLRDMPGTIFRSVEILIGSRADFDWESEAQFEQSRVVSSMAFGGAARIWSDFTIKKNQAGKILVEDLALQNDEASRLVQTLLEIGNYRKLALLGFPIARSLMPWITEAEARHAKITEEMQSAESNRAEILADLLGLSAEVEFRAGAARYRLGATDSYHLLTRDRLASLRETRVEGFSTWSEFVERRLLPAMRTCEISQARLDGLSERINRSASLLSLEQSVGLNKRSQASLASMNRRAMLQLRLQSLVEGFSIFAISYYIVGLAEHVLDPLLVSAQVESLKRQLVAMLVPASIVLTWLALNRRRLTSDRGR